MDRTQRHKPADGRRARQKPTHSPVPSEAREWDSTPPLDALAYAEDCGGYGHEPPESYGAAFGGEADKSRSSIAIGFDRDGWHTVVDGKVDRSFFCFDEAAADFMRAADALLAAVAAAS